MSASGPSFTHNDLAIVFWDFLKKLFTDAASLEPHQRVIFTHEGERGLHGSKTAIPDSILTMRKGGQNYRFFWIEVCKSESVNHVFEKLNRMIGDGLRPLLGIFVILAKEKRNTGVRIPCTVLPEWRTRGTGLETFQEHDIIHDFDPNDLPDLVFDATGFPELRHPDVMDIWGSETCPPRAYDGVKVHGSLEVTAIFIPPSRFLRLLDACSRPRDRLQWAETRFLLQKFPLSTFLDPREDSPFWTQLGFQLIAFRRILSRMRQSPPPFFAPPIDGPDAYKDGLWDWAKREYGNFDSPDFVGRGDADFGLLWPEIRRAVLNQRVIHTFWDTVVSQGSEASHCWGRKRLTDKMKAEEHEERRRQQQQQQQQQQPALLPPQQQQQQPPPLPVQHQQDGSSSSSTAGGPARHERRRRH